MVCDIRGFSTMSERLPGPDLAQLLGKRLGEAGNLVQRGQGTIDKFIGDALLAYWVGTVDCDAVLAIARQLDNLRTSANGRAGNPSGSRFRCILGAGDLQRFRNLSRARRDLHRRYGEYGVPAGRSGR